MKTFRQRLLKVVFEVMRPLARLLLDAGVGYKDFARVAKLAFVDVSLRHYGLRGRKTNSTRVAVMTGLTRREVSHLRRQISQLSLGDVPIALAPSDVLHFWQQDQEYLGGDGYPLEIPFEGDGPSFTKLVRNYGGDVTPGAVRAELKRVGALAELPGGKLKLVKPYFVPSGSEERLLVSLRQNVRSLISTVAYNSDNPRKGPGRIERFVYSDRLTSAQIESLRSSIRDSVEAYTKQVDDHLAALELVNRESANQPAGRTVAVGVYFFEEDEYSR